MNPEVTVGLALYDYLPNLIWIAGSYFLINTLKAELKKNPLYILIISLTLVLIAGTLKATWKLLIAAVDANILILSDIQFPLMGTGFFLMFLSLLSLLLKKDKGGGEKQLAVAIPFSKIFLPLMILGSFGSTICLIIIAKRRKAILALTFYVIFLVTSSTMGYIGSKIVTHSYLIVLIEQTLNSCSTLMWALGSYFLWKTHRERGTLVGISEG
jgi:hypothetical protein